MQTRSPQFCSFCGTLKSCADRNMRAGLVRLCLRGRFSACSGFRVGLVVVIEQLLGNRSRHTWLVNNESSAHVSGGFDGPAKILAGR